jgi:hypothetical protein
MSGQGRGRFGRGRFGGRFKGKGGHHNSKKGNEVPKERKVLSDYIFNIGSSKQASEFELVSQFIINHIRKEYEDGNDVGDALEERKEVDFDQFKPGLVFSQHQDQITRDKEDQ